MAHDLPKKSKQKSRTGPLPVVDRELVHQPAHSGPSPFTAEQRQILGNVYQLILSWRRERRTKLASQCASPAEREA